MSSDVKHTAEPWWTDAKYDGREYGCSIIAARTDAGPLPGNPTRGQVAFVTAILNTEARRCEANAARIVACVNALEGIPDPAAFMEQHKKLVEAAEALVGETLGGDLAEERGEVKPRGSYNAWISWEDRWLMRQALAALKGEA